DYAAALKQSDVSDTHNVQLMRSFTADSRDVVEGNRNNLPFLFAGRQTTSISLEIQLSSSRHTRRYIAMISNMDIQPEVEQKTRQFCHHGSCGEQAVIESRQARLTIVLLYNGCACGVIKRLSCDQVTQLSATISFYSRNPTSDSGPGQWPLPRGDSRDLETVLSRHALACPSPVLGAIAYHVQCTAAMFDSFYSIRPNLWEQKCWEHINGGSVAAAKWRKLVWTLS
ncbi:hypothetical protein BaRGS_00007050, partial [Batillaria attramentaria]